MDETLISVIVPVYKVEEYLDRCVESIVNQTYAQLEIILVDDGSPDRCPQMCDDWAEKDPRIHVIHKQNGGLSDARNAGISAATGDYIGFVDSDDWISTDYYLSLLRSAEENNAQIAAASVVQVYDDHEEYDPQITQVLYSNEEAMDTLIHGKVFRATAWNKLYRSDIFKQLRFPVGKLHEDEFVTYKAISSANRLAFCEKSYYYYRQRSGSIMHSISERHLDAFDAYIERLEFFRCRYPELYFKDKPTICKMAVWYYIQTLECNCQNAKTIQKKIINYRQTVRFTNTEIMKYDLPTRIYIICSSINLGFFSRLLMLKEHIHA